MLRNKVDRIALTTTTGNASTASSSSSRGAAPPPLTLSPTSHTFNPNSTTTAGGAMSMPPLSPLIPPFLSSYHAPSANTSSAGGKHTFVDFDLAQRLARLELEVRSVADHLNSSDVRLDTGGEKLDVLAAVIEKQAAQAAAQGAQLAEVLASQEKHHKEVAELRRLFKSIVALCTSTSEKLEDTRGEVRRLKAQHAEEAAARARLETRLASEVALRTQLEVKLKNTQEEVARLARAAGETVSEEYGGRGDEDVTPDRISRRMSWLDAADKDIALRRRSLQSPQVSSRMMTMTPPAPREPVTPPETPRIGGEMMPTISESSRIGVNETSAARRAAERALMGDREPREPSGTMSAPPPSAFREL